VFDVGRMPSGVDATAKAIAAVCERPREVSDVVQAVQAEAIACFHVLGIDFALGDKMQTRRPLNTCYIGRGRMDDPLRTAYGTRILPLSDDPSRSRQLDQDPHYHYIYDDKDDPHLHRVDFDWIVNGAMYQWLLPVPRAKMPTLIAHAGRHQLAATCEQQRDVWVGALDEVERYVATLGLAAVSR